MKELLQNDHQMLWSVIDSYFVNFNILFLLVSSRYVWSGLLVVLGIFLNVYSKNMDKVRLPSLVDLINKTVDGKKPRTLAQTV